jgi:peptidoglycan/xylan/chitin deacetylase (PgdA/CDA1 family)
LRLVNFTPGTKSNADYTGEAERNFVPSQQIYESILAREHEDPAGLNGYLLLLHIGAGPGRADKMHDRLGSLLDALSARSYRFVRVDELLR